MVVSERGDNLSPKYAPEITAPAVTSMESPDAPAIPTSDNPTVPAVVQELPIEMDTIALSNTAAI